VGARLVEELAALAPLSEIEIREGRYHRFRNLGYTENV
jgi:acetyl-CoA carboxylase alpha subunit